MQCVIIFACLVAAASAGYNPYNGAYHGGPAVDPVAIAAGAPLPVGDTYEVAAAKAAHFRAHADAAHQNGVHNYNHGSPYAYNQYATPYAHHGYASEPRQVDPAAIAAGAPVPTGDTYEVAAAKAAHLRAHAEVSARNGHASAVYPQHSYGHAAPAYNSYNGYNGYASPYNHHGFASEARQVDPVAIAAGAPLPTGDTYEVAAAKAAHLRAHAEAKSGNYGRYRRGLGYSSLAYAAPLHYATPLAYAPHSYSYSTVTAHHAPLAYSLY